MKESDGKSSRVLYRVAGASYVLSIVARMIADGAVRDRLVRANDAGATAANILSHESLFRAGFVAEMVALATFVVVIAVVHELLKPSHPAASRAAMLLGLTATIVQAVSSAFHSVAITILQSGDALTGFTPAQVQSLALLSLKIRSVAFHSVGLVFLGLYCLTVGVLAYRTALLPRAVAVLMALAGVAYLPFVVAGFARSLMPFILIPVGVGQVAFALALLFAGVFKRKERSSGPEVPRSRGPEVPRRL